MTTVSLQLVIAIFGSWIAFFGLGFLLGRAFEAQSWWSRGWQKREEKQ